MTIKIVRAEKRRSQRVSAGGPVSFTGLKETREAHLKNISKNGVCCFSRMFIPEMTEVALAIRLPALPEEKEDHYLLQCRGAVVRCDPVIKNNSVPKWEIGIFFTELDPEASALLDRYIASRSCE